MAEKKKVPAVVAPASSDKKKALETAIAKIEKDYGKGTIMRLGDDISVNVEALSTGSLSLDLALGIGGVPRGRIVEIYGPEASGKTPLALHVVASAQKNGGDAAYIDVEHALEPAYARESSCTALSYWRRRSADWTARSASSYRRGIRLRRMWRRTNGRRIC